MASIEELSLSDKEEAVVETGELASVQVRFFHLELGSAAPPSVLGDGFGGRYDMAGSVVGRGLE